MNKRKFAYIFSLIAFSYNLICTLYFHPDEWDLQSLPNFLRSVLGWVVSIFMMFIAYSLSKQLDIFKNPILHATYEELEQDTFKMFLAHLQATKLKKEINFSHQFKYNDRNLDQAILLLKINKLKYEVQEHYDNNVLIDIDFSNQEYI